MFARLACCRPFGDAPGDEPGFAPAVQVVDEPDPRPRRLKRNTSTETKLEVSAEPAPVACDRRVPPEPEKDVGEAALPTVVAPALAEARTASDSSSPRSFVSSPRSSGSARHTHRSLKQECVEDVARPDSQTHQKAQSQAEIVEDPFAKRLADVEAAEREHGVDSLLVVEPLRALATAYGAAGRVSEQIKILDRVLRVAAETLGRHDPLIAETLVELATAHGRQGGKWTKVKKELLEQALQIQMGAFGSSSPEVAHTRVRLANACGDLGNVQEKARLLTEALKILRAVYSEDHPEVAVALTNLGNAHMVLGNVEEQRLTLQRSLDIKERLYGREHPELTVTLTSLSNAYSRSGEQRLQKELLERALRITQKHHGPNHWRTATILDNMGAMYIETGECSEAVAVIQQALSIKEAAYGKDHPKVAVTLANMGLAHGIARDFDMKLKFMREAYAILQKACGAAHPQTRRVKKWIEETEAMPNFAKSKQEAETQENVWVTSSVAKPCLEDFAHLPADISSTTIGSSPAGSEGVEDCGDGVDQEPAISE